MITTKKSINIIKLVVFSLLFVLSFSFISVSASDIVNGGSDSITPSLTDAQYNKINGSKYLVEYLRQGGSIEINSASSYTAIDLLDDVADFFNGTIADLCGDDGYWINNISYTQEPQYIYLKEPQIVKFVNFGLDFLSDMIPGEEQPAPEVPPDYNTIIDNINGSGFYFKDYTINNGTAYTPIVPTDIQHMSWIKAKNDSNNKQKYPSPIISFNISETQDGKWSVVYSGYSESDYTSLSGSNMRFKYNIDSNTQKLNQNNIGTNYFGINFYSSSDFASQFNVYFDTLSLALSRIANFCKNVNIYVNGEPWSIVHVPHFIIKFGDGTFIDGTNTPVEYDFPDPEQNYKIDLTDLIDRLDTLIDNQNKITFPDISNLIVDENGQQAIAVYVVNQDLSVDDWYIKNYGTLLPIFPVSVTLPHLEETVNIATIGIVDVIPSDILEIFGIALVGMLFVTWIHRLLE